MSLAVSVTARTVKKKGRTKVYDAVLTEGQTEFLYENREMLAKLLNGDGVELSFDSHSMRDAGIARDAITIALTRSGFKPVPPLAKRVKGESYFDSKANGVQNVANGIVSTGYYSVRLVTGRIANNFFEAFAPEEETESN